jgi:hypothetical protein
MSLGKVKRIQIRMNPHYFWSCIRFQILIRVKSWIRIRFNVIIRILQKISNPAGSGSTTTLAEIRRIFKQFFAQE